MNEETLFAAAMELKDPALRAAFLDRACAGDQTLRLSVEELLKAHERAGAFLETPAVPEHDLTYCPETRGTHHAAGAPDRLGTQIGAYKLVQRLGEGGMGTVYLAEQEEPVKRCVALKIIKAGMDSAHVLARFEAERQALALMDHPNIAKVLDAGTTEENLPYFVMELVKGIPLTKHCDDLRLTPQERLALFIPVCEAVQHAHQKGIIHRDLKPSNILVALYDRKPIPKVIDFGVAKATQQKLTERTMFTEVGQIIGTLEYMAPEQAEPTNLDIDTRADVYSLGVVLYELLTGAPPFSIRELCSAAYTEMLRLIKDVEPPKPSTKLSSTAELASIAANRRLEPKRLRQLVHGDLDWIVMKCLEKERSRRYDSANGLAHDLQRYLADEPVLAGPPSASYRLRKFVSRHRRAVAAALLVLVVLLGGIVGTTLGMVRAVDEANRATEAEQQVTAHLEEVTKQRDRATAAEQQVKKEAAVAHAVNGFLLSDLLGQANPNHHPDRDVKLRTLLDRAAAKVAGRFADLPLVEAAVRYTLGDAYGALGDYLVAIQHLEISLGLRRRELGSDHADTLQVINALAGNYNGLGRYADAEKLVGAVSRSATARPSAEMGGMLENQLAGAAFHQGRYRQAESLWLRVLDKYQAQFGDRDHRTLQVMENLAAAYLALDKHTEAAGLRQQALEGLREKLGEDHPLTLRVANNLGEVYFRQSRMDEAEKLVSQAYAGRRRVLGEDHLDTIESLGNLGVLLLVRAKYVEAEPILIQTLEARRLKLGPEHANTLASLNNLAMLHERRGEFAKAEGLFKELLAVRRRSHGEVHPVTLDFAYNLGEVLLFQGKHAEAEGVFRRNAEIRKQQAQPAQRPKLAADLELWAWALVMQDRSQEAEPLLRESLGMREQRTLRRHFSEVLLGACLQKQKRYDEAEPLLLNGCRGLMARTKELPGGKARLLTDSLSWLVQLYEARGKQDEAAKWRQELEAAQAAAKQPR